MVVKRLRATILVEIQVCIIIKAECIIPKSPIAFRHINTGCRIILDNNYGQTNCEKDGLITNNLFVHPLIADLARFFYESLLY